MREARSHYVQPGWRRVFDHFGVSLEDTLRTAQLPLDLLEGPGASLSNQEYFRLWRTLEAQAPDPRFPIRVAETLTGDGSSPPVFAALCSPNFEVAARRIAHYKRLIGPLVMDVTRTEFELEVQCRWLAMAEVPPASFLTMEAAFLTRLARLGTKLHIRPLEVRLPQHLPGADIESFLGVRPVHGDIFTFVISAEDAQRPFATANDTMWHILEPALERRLDELAREASMTERVRTVLAELLPIRRGTAEEVSARVGTGVRTLQRRLRDEGQSFQEILSATRLQLARNYLQTTSLSCSEISGLLGYQNPSSFSRAFQSWTGVSPEKARSTSEVMRRAG